MTRRVTSVRETAEACEKNQKAASASAAEKARRREEVQLALRSAEAAARLADEAFEPIAAARDAAGRVSAERAAIPKISSTPRPHERLSIESTGESSPEDAPPPKKKSALPLSPIAPATRAKYRSWTPERKAEEAAAEADALAEMLTKAARIR